MYDPTHTAWHSLTSCKLAFDTPYVEIAVGSEYVLTYSELALFRTLCRVLH